MHLLSQVTRSIVTETQEQTALDEPVHFFISHTGVDRRWAEWIGWQLEAEGYRIILDAWDFKTGTSFVGAMEDAASRAERTLVVASSDYFQAPLYDAGMGGRLHPRQPGGNRPPAAGDGEALRAASAVATASLH
ncbi:hypothetical protein C2W62_03060 [Candidatus Entotheonella serta]|nr:hypothetical protein C2W62_03060 [Candidatus Entotheonella serta]